MDPALNRAIAYGNFDYVALTVKDVAEGSKAKIGDTLVVAKDLVKSFTETAKIAGFDEGQSFSTV